MGKPSRAAVLAIAGTVTLILYVVGAIAIGSPPDAAASGSEVVAWFGEHQDAVRLCAWTLAVSSLTLAIVAGILVEALPSPHRFVFLIGAAGLAIETVVQGWIWAGLALHPDSLEPATARTALDIADFWGPLLTGATTAMIGAVTVLGLQRPPSIPRWMTILGAIAFAEQLIETVTVFGTSGFIEPGGDMNRSLGAGLTLIWLGAFVVWVVRGGNATRARMPANG